MVAESSRSGAERAGEHLGCGREGGLSNRRRRKGGKKALLACHEAGARTTGGIDREGAWRGELRYDMLWVSVLAIYMRVVCPRVRRSDAQVAPRDVRRETSDGGLRRDVRECDGELDAHAVISVCV